MRTEREKAKANETIKERRLENTIKVVFTREKERLTDR